MELSLIKETWWRWTICFMWLFCAFDTNFLWTIIVQGVRINSYWWMLFMWFIWLHIAYGGHGWCKEFLIFPENFGGLYHLYFVLGLKHITYEPECRIIFILCACYLFSSLMKSDRVLLNNLLNWNQFFWLFTTIFEDVRCMLNCWYNIIAIVCIICEIQSDSLAALRDLSSFE